LNIFTVREHRRCKVACSYFNNSWPSVEIKYSSFASGSGHSSGGMLLEVTFPSGQFSQLEDVSVLCEGGGRRGEADVSHVIL